MKTSTDLLACCGLYCGDCGGYSGEIAEKAKALIKTIKKFKFELTVKNMFTEQIKDYDEFFKNLEFVSGLKCPQTCRERKIGSTDCKIRECCFGKGFFACYECKIFETCEKLEVMKELYKDSCIQNLQAIKEMGLENWIENGKRLWFGSEMDK